MTDMNVILKKFEKPDEIRQLKKGKSKSCALAA